MSNYFEAFPPGPKPIRPRVLVFGCGALGSVVAYYFAEAGCDLTVVCRSNYKTARRNGFSIDFGSSQAHFRPRVTRTCTQAAAVDGHQPYDVVIVTSKAVSSTDIAALIAPVVEPGHTTILLIQNGVGIEQDFYDKYPQNLLLTCVAYCFATQLRPAQTSMLGNGKLELGPYPDSDASQDIPAAAQHILDMASDTRLLVNWHHNIQERRWLKLVLNAPYNSMCALTRVDQDAMLSGPGGLALSVVHGVMDEIVAIAHALGFMFVTRQHAEELLRDSRQADPDKPIKPSMLVDVQYGREMESEVILGNPLRHAKSLGIVTPRLEMLYLMTRVMNQELVGPKVGAHQPQLQERL